MEYLIKSGAGWRIGWNPHAPEFKGLIGTDHWAIELTEAAAAATTRLEVPPLAKPQKNVV